MEGSIHIRETMMIVWIYSCCCWVVWNAGCDDFGNPSIVIEVLVAKVGVLVGDTGYVDSSDSRIASTWSTRLDMGTSIGTYDQTVRAVNIETVLCAYTCRNKKCLR
jgi:hypothetical protein